MSLLLLAALALGVLIGWVAAKNRRSISKRQEAPGWVFMPTCYKHWSSQDKALEAIEKLSSLRRAASATPDKDKSPSFRQSLTRLESQFQGAWQDYRDGHFQAALDTANEAYREFR